VVGLLSRTGVAHVQERTALYFRDIYDHLVRLYEQIDAARDLIGNAMDVYLSVVANKTNDITKQLTIFAAIFLPLSFVAGFFGQNFDVLSKTHFFIAMLACMGLIPIGMVIYFWRKGWL
jgi:magnesium transporter